MHTVKPFFLKATSPDYKTLLIIDEKNRDISSNHLRMMRESLLLFKKQLRPIIVMRKRGKFFILDGQHLYKALISLGWDIWYEVIEIKDEAELIRKIAMINSTSKKWTVRNFIDLWAPISQHYRILRDLLGEYRLDVCNLASLLSGNGPVNSGSYAIEIQSGRFEIVNRCNTIIFLNNLEDIFKVVNIKRVVRHTRYITREYFNLMAVRKSYNHRKFLRSLKVDDIKLRVSAHIAGELFK
jgi:hypothetical protein